MRRSTRYVADALGVALALAGVAACSTASSELDGGEAVPVSDGGPRLSPPPEALETVALRPSCRRRGPR